MYPCICIHVYVSMYMYPCIYVSMYIRIYIQFSMYIYMYMYIFSILGNVYVTVLNLGVKGHDKVAQKKNIPTNIYKYIYI